MTIRGGPKSRETSDVLITQGAGRIAYNVVRSLGRHGLKVVVGADSFSSMAGFSRYATERFRHPFLTTQTEDFVAAVREALHHYSPKVYLPMGDDTYVVAKYIEEFQGTGVTIPIAPFETLKRLAEKNELVSLAKLLRIPVPETIVPRDHNDLKSFCKDYGSPIVLKRISSSGARGVFYLTEEDLATFTRGDSPAGNVLLRDCVVQQYIRGVGIGVSMLFNHGKLRAQFTHRRLREKPVTGGVSTLRVGVVNPLLEEYAQRLLESVNFHGVAMVEFKYDDKTGKGWLVEVNPRFWGSLALAIHSGVDFPSLLYRMATEGDVSPVVAYRTGLVVKWIAGDIFAVVGRLHRRRRPPSNIQWALRSNGYDDFHWDDPFPFFAGAALSLRKVFRTRNWTPDELDLNIERLVQLSSGQAR